MKPYFREWLLLLAASGSWSHSEALQASEADDPDRLLETVVVTATRQEARVQDVAVAIDSVDRDSVFEQAPDTVAELFRGQPGAFFQQTTPGQGIPIIRGLKGSQVLHMVDGLRLNNAFFRSAPNQYLGLVDSYALQSVELVRGSAGSLYGADAMGGVVQLLTPEPRFDSSDWQGNSRIYGSWDSVNSGLVARAEHQAGRDGLGLQAGVTWQDYGDRETGGGATVAPSGYSARAFDTKLLADWGASADVMVSIQVMEQPDSPRTDELVPGFGQTQPSSQQYAFKPNRRSFGHLRYRRDFAYGVIDRLQVNLARQVITDDRLTQDFGSPEINHESNESRLDGLTVQADNALGDGGVLTWGLEVYQDRVRSQRLREFTEAGVTRPVSSRFPDGSSMDSLSAYGSVTHDLGNRATVTAGLRYSVFDIFLPGGASVPETRLEPSDFTGDIRWLYRVSDSVNLVANLGRGFRPPNIFDLGTLGPRPGNRFNVANTDLDPESVLSYDLGIKAVQPGWQAEAYLYYLDYSDKITSVLTGDVTPDGRLVVRSENRNRVSIYGLETGFRWFISDTLDLYGSVNYTRGEEQAGPGLEVPADRIPPLTANIGLRWRWRDNLEWEVQVDSAARQDRLSPRDADDPRMNPAGTPGWTSWNLGLSWFVNDQTTLGVRLENLADSAYREHGSGLDAPGRNVGLWGSLQF